jgi:PAN domain
VQFIYICFTYIESGDLLGLLQMCSDKIKDGKTLLSTDCFSDCPAWTSFNQQQVVGGTPSAATNLTACLDACAANPSCRGVDYSASPPPCWLHLSALTPQPTAAIVTQYLINRSCLGVATSGKQQTASERLAMALRTFISKFS